MAENHIFVVDDEEAVCNSLAQKMDNLYGDNYIISKFLDANEAIEFTNDIDEEEDNLALIISDEKLNGMQGHEFLEIMTKTHPLSKKILNSAYSIEEPLKKVVNLKIDGFANKEGTTVVGDQIFNLSDKLIKEYESEPRLEFTIANTTFSLVDTLYKKNAFGNLRYSVYLDEGHKTQDMFREEEINHKMEWDEHDVGGIDALIINPHVRYLVAMKDNKCVSGVRIIDGDLPMETGNCISDKGVYKKGDKLDLMKLTDQYSDVNIYKREISRLINHPNERDDPTSVSLFGLFRMVEQITKDQETMFCTATPGSIGLYQAVGFEIIGPDITYSLAGEWTPLMRNRWKAHNEPESIGMGPNEIGLHKMVTKPIKVTNAEQWSKYSESLNKAAIQTGYYNAK
jgi:hypothetical protein